jgi:hypothetical protein
MVSVNLETGSVTNDVKSLFKQAQKKTMKKTAKKVGNTAKGKLVKTGKKYDGGGYFGNTFRKLMEKIKSIRGKNQTSENIEYVIERNAENTGDVCKIVKDGVTINETNIEDHKMGNFLTNTMNSIKNLFKRMGKKSDNKTGGETNNNTNGAIPFPTKITIGEDTSVYNFIYRRRNAFDIFGRILLHFIFIFLFGLFYIIFVLMFYGFKGEIPLSIYQKYLIINGKELPL